MEVKTKNVNWNETISDPNSDVIINITIGNAQIGGSTLSWKNSPGTVIAKGEIINVNSGKGSAIKGKTLLITTNILDANEQTNAVVATYTFSNCTPPATVLHDSVDDDGDIFSFVIEVAFN